MGIIVGRWLKDGKKKVWSTQFETKEGAKRVANKVAQKYGKAKGKMFEVGEPFRHGAYWNVYIHEIKVGRY